MATRADLDARISKLSAEQQALLRQRLRGATAARAPAVKSPLSSLPKRPDPASAPLSYSQQRLWFLDQLEPGGCAYNETMALRLAGGLDPDRLKRALESLVRRHEVLRTTFALRGEQPVQIIRELGQVEVVTAELGAGFDEGAEIELWPEAIRSHVQQPFDLRTGPLMRTGLFGLPDGRALLLIVIHHIVTDGWSVRIFIDELTALYRTNGDVAAAGLAPLAVQYADYAEWQRSPESEQARERGLEFWKRQLAGAPADHGLPFALRPNTESSHDGGIATFEIAPGVASRLGDVTRQSGCSLFVTLLSTFAVLLRRHAGRPDIVIGTPVANRGRREITPLIGFFVNSLALRIDTGGDGRFTDLLGRMHRTMLEALDHQDTPFESVVEAINPQRALDRNPLFQVVMTLQEGALRPFSFDGVGAEPVFLDPGAAKFDLTLHFENRSSGLSGRFEYNASRIDAATMERLARSYETLLAQIAEAPSTPVAEMARAPEAEKQWVLGEWNDTAVGFDRDATLPGRFEAQVRRRPDAIAMVAGSEELTYQQLNDRADGWARALIARGVRAETRVGICLERGADLLVALLAVLKAGGAYVPLDPGHPGERLRFMLEDGGCSLLLTRSDLAAEIAAAIDWVDPSVEFTGDDAAGALPNVDLDPASLAYLIFTSGSTGLPKAVAVAHRAVVNLAFAQRAGFGITAEQRVAWFASVGFDASVSEIWTALDTGATLVVADEDERASPATIHAFLAKQRINAVTLPPTVWAQLPDALPDLRVAVSAGERCPVEIVNRWSGPTCTFINAYGPTEITVCATLGEVAADDPEPSIGRPIANTGCYVLDQSGRPVPIGVVGELYVSGEGVARGYEGRTGLTAERFVPHPFATRPGERLYRTGDLARHRSDGSLEYRGRVDGQVKLRGYRIEPGEIEALIDEHPAVTGCAVVVRERRGENDLFAYVVPAVDPFPVAELRADLRRRLPDYMMPAAFSVLEDFPRNAHGKIDRVALPAPAVDRETLSQDYTAPTTSIEAVLARLWSELLDVPQVGVHDDFFELGGHSLLAAQIVARVEAQLGVAQPLRDFFEHPSVAQQARIVTERQNVVTLAMETVPREGWLPVSFLQERLWFLHKLDPTSPDYNVPVALRLRGDLNIGALEEACSVLRSRHEVLRTVFAEEDGRPVARAGAPGDFTFEVESLPANLATTEEADAAARRWATQGASRAFDLQAGPLMRAQLLRLSPTDHWLLLTLHHIVTDGWSTSVLIEELGTAYETLAAGTAERSLPPPSALQYADFAVWQRRWFTAERLAPQMDYWRDRLSGLEPFDLPGDLPRPTRLERRGLHHVFALDQDLAEALRAFSQSCGATVFMTALAAFKVLLFRYTRSEDIAVGVPMSNRSRAETASMLGFFVNTLVMRTDLAGGPTFRELLGRVRQRTLEAHANQDVPFDRLVEEVKVPREAGRPPLVSVFFVWQNAPQPLRALGDVSVEPVGLETGVTKFDLTLELSEGEQSIEGMIEFDRDLYTPSLVERLADHFQQLLRAIVADPETPIHDLNILSSAEQKQIVGEWSGRPSPYPREETVHRLFELQARQRADAVAVMVGPRGWTYRELDETANRIARYLSARGIGLESRIGVGLARGFEQMAVILGTLKAGAAYVPLDPDSPLSRARVVVADSRCRLVIGSLCREASESAAGSANTNPDEVDVISETELFAEIESLPATALEVPGDPSLAAYVIYTSGSTGMPKGVEVPHRGVIRLVMETDFAEFGAEQIVLYHSPLSFDASTLEIWSAFLQGGRLGILPPGPPSLTAYARWLREYEVSTVWLTASLFHALVDEQVEALTGARQVLAGGDVLQVPTVEKFRRHCPNGQMINGYGPTENTTLTTCHPVGRDEVLAPSVPIGRPIANTQVYILDRRMRPVPPGVLGELFTGGDGLARGYANRPGFSAERFVPHPFATEPGERLYRTGDYAQFRADGTIEFLGRMDHQVKIRGFRVELGEIESALAAHADISSCAVLSAPDPAGGKRIVAFYVSRESVSADDLRRFLQEQVPAYMVPAVFVEVDDLPQTSSGKVDRKKLATPAALADAAESSVDGPRDATEKALVGIWSDLLGVARVGIHDNFFELGGHSLLATRVVSRIATILHTTIELHEFFEHTTIAELAAHLQSLKREQLSPIESVDRSARSSLPLSSAQERLWFIDRLKPNSAGYNVPVGLWLSGPLNTGALSGAIDALVVRHEALRTVFPEEDGTPYLEIQPAVGGILQRIDLTTVPADDREAELRRHGETEARKGFNLATGPLFRAQLLNFAPTEHAVLLTFHHIITDGWSLGIFLRELEAEYAARWSGRAADLPSPRLHYADFACWQRARGETAVAPHVEYWQQHLAGLPPLDLPTDSPRPPVQQLRGERFDVNIDADTVARLRRIGQPDGATLFMTLLAAFDVLLWRWTGQRDFAIGTPIANRNHPDTEDMIGFFVNTLVLRSRIDPRQSFADLLRQVKQTALAGYEHQDLPFEQLVTALNVPRDRSRTPLFQVMLVLQNAPMAVPDLSGLAVEAREYDTQLTKFDLTLSFIERTDGGLSGSVEYDVDLFARATIERLVAAFSTALENIAADSTQRIDQIDVLPRADRRLLLEQWGGERQDLRPATTGLDLIAEQVAARPDAEALVGPAGSMTYRELDEASNQLAHVLRREGVGAESRVGLCFSRGLEMVVTILGLIKAGGAYVPLDPEYPSARVAFMLEDSGCELLLVHGVSPESLPVTTARMVTWESLQAECATAPVTAPTHELHPEQAAYLIYTSGSTGVPKAILVPHRGLVNLQQTQIERFSIGPGTRVVQFASLNFDASVTEIWDTFGAGGTLVVADEEARRSPKALEALLRKERIACATLPPTLLNVLSDELPDLAVPISAGERCPAQLVERWSRPDRPLLNAYGPSEITVCVTTAELPVGSKGTPPIGRPLPNTTCHVLTPDGRLASPGVAGELHVGGIGVARGYWRRAALTADRFVPDPFADEPGARLYRTGDSVRWRSDGQLEFLGRMDDQVKLRGMRVELGEIENVLTGHEAVRRCAVVCRADAQGDDRLLAYVVGERVPRTELQAYLKTRLPAHMVPAQFGYLDELPLNPSGKVDHRALPEIGTEETGADSPDGTKFNPPESPLEKALAADWCAVLDVPRVSRDDNFFEVGGNSMKAVQLLERLEPQYPGVFTIGDLFDHHTVAQQALRIAPPAPKPTQAARKPRRLTL